MFSTERILNKLHEQQKPLITLESLLTKVTEYDIFAKYIGDFRIGNVYNSPLRDDSNASLGIFVSNRDNVLLYKDLSTGDCGNVVKFVKKLKGLTTYKETLEEIAKDLNIYSMTAELKHRKIYEPKSKDISVVRKPFNHIDLDFWAKFYISKETLDLFKVASISKYVLNGIVKAEYAKDNPMYCYKVFNKFKIYRPLDTKSNKWRGNLGSLDIQGFEQLPESGELLIITKSLKDVMTLHELGYVAIAPASESVIIPDIAINTLKRRFKRIIVFYDRDRTGMQFTRKMVRLHAFEFMFINKKHKQKDISDFVKEFGSKRALNILNEMI